MPPPAIDAFLAAILGLLSRHASGEKMSHRHF